MVFSKKNALIQALDVAGSFNHNQNLNINDESFGLGQPILGQTGSNASITDSIGNVITLIGLTGMSNNSVGRMITINNASDPNNNGTFLIINCISNNSVNIFNPNGTGNDFNNNLIEWVERSPYSLQDDLNYIRTDRKLIKGTQNYFDNVPSYNRPDNKNLLINTNLKNISGKTTDAVSYIINKSYFNIDVNQSDSFITLSSTGNFKHSDNVNTIGVPCYDFGNFSGDIASCYVHIVDGDKEGTELLVLSGPNEGERIFGIIHKGLSISPDSIEIHFYSSPFFRDYSVVNNPYIWEQNQTSKINIIYGYNERLDNLEPNALRTIPSLGILTDAGDNSIKHSKLRQLIHLADNEVGGPFEGFDSGSYSEVIYSNNSPFYSERIWYTDNTKQYKIVENIVTRNSTNMPTTITWNAYDVDGITILSSITDNIYYNNNIFEIYRTRTIN